MNIPQVFIEFFSLALNQDFYVIYGTVENALINVYMSLKSTDKAELKSFILLVLDSNMSDNDLGILWNKSGADIDVPDMHVRDFLQKTLDTILESEMKEAK